MLTNETRLFVKGTEEDCKAFTLHLTWYHSGAGRIVGINRNDEDGTITLNLYVDQDRVKDVEDWAAEYNLKKMNW